MPGQAGKPRPRHGLGAQGVNLGVNLGLPLEHNGCFMLRPLPLRGADCQPLSCRPCKTEGVRSQSHQRQENKRKNSSSLRRFWHKSSQIDRTGPRLAALGSIAAFLAVWQYLGRRPPVRTGKPVRCARRDWKQAPAPAWTVRFRVRLHSVVTAIVTRAHRVEASDCELSQRHRGKPQRNRRHRRRPSIAHQQRNVRGASPVFSSAGPKRATAATRRRALGVRRVVSIHMESSRCCRSAVQLHRTDQADGVRPDADRAGV